MGARFVAPRHRVSGSRVVTLTVVVVAHGLTLGFLDQTSRYNPSQTARSGQAPAVPCLRNYGRDPSQMIMNAEVGTILLLA